MRIPFFACAALLACCCLSPLVGYAAQVDGETARPKQIAIVAGPKSHGPEGNGIHDYGWSARLLKVMLDNSNVRDQVEVTCYLDEWPADPAALEQVDTLLVISDGRDGDLYQEALHLASPERVAQVERLVRRGGGVMTFHFSTFAPDHRAVQILDWTGGYFDWETDGERKWYSAIETREADVQLATPDHPVNRGVRPLRLREEFYFNLRFHPDPQSVTPIWTVPDLPGREERGDVVAWARQRPDGGRGFGTTVGHFYDNWEHPDFRKMVLNAIVWTAGMDVPEGGVEANYYTREQIEAAFSSVNGSEPALLDETPVRVLLLTGHDGPFHNWRETHVVIKEALEQDPRVQVEVATDIEVLARADLSQYDALIQNYCNWERPEGLSERAKDNLVKYLRAGGGLSVIHFANGAFHYSLPGAGQSDWPEYRRIVRRVWDHHGQSSHDMYRRFEVHVTDVEHPITTGMPKSFFTTDELYFHQAGEEPIIPLLTAESEITRQQEPLAWAYDYGKGRVFQTLLGHDAPALRTPAVMQLVRQGTLWAGDRKIFPVKAPAAAPQLGDGRFGQALDARQGGALAEGSESFRSPPLTVECWAKLDRKDSYNILVANETKASGTHWELFTEAGSGHLAVYMPGMRPDHARTQVDVCDGEWHYLAMVYEPHRVRLLIDGHVAAEQALESAGRAPQPGALAIGRLVEGGLGCAGSIDEVRITRAVREISTVPEQRLKSDEATIGLWHFDEIDEAVVPDASPGNHPLRAALQASPSGGNSAPAEQAHATAQRKVDEHYSQSVIGFDWTEDDSRDGRWNEVDIGRFLASTIVLPTGTVRKALSIRIGPRQEAAVCYDTEHPSFRALWTGDFLRFDPTRFGLIRSPEIAGQLQVAFERPAEGQAQYVGMYQHGERVVLKYEASGTPIFESPWLERTSDESSLTRTFLVGPSREPVQFEVARRGSAWQLEQRAGISMAVQREGEHITAIALKPDSPFRLQAAAGQVLLQAPAQAQPRRCQLFVWTGSLDRLDKFVTLVHRSAAPADLARWMQPGPPRWTAEIVTRGVLGESNDAYTVDTLTLPIDNPYRALFFTSGHDFFSNGDIALATIHGDVWRVSGVDAKLERLSWKRYATGLFQPLGLKVVDDHVYVLGRDQITRLEDRDGNGEADYYANFVNDYLTSPEGHDYVACLETDPSGNFYFVHATQGVVRVSRDGQRVESIATGLRNPNGLGVGPDGTITASPQEGEWTPASSVVRVEPGNYFGYKGPKVTADRPLGYDPPLCWIPRRQDNSSGGQTWVTSDRWGPLAGELLHFSFGQCRMLLVLREQVGSQWQGGTVTFPLEFDSGVMRGRFSPRDGQLYVSGLRGWVTNAVQDGCLQRVRYTGQPLDLPVSVRTLRNGLAVRFTRPLDKDSAEDPGSYQVQQWNYIYREQYGSPDLRLSDPQQEGRDEVEVLSATLLDPQTVFLELADVQPVSQMSIRYELTAHDGRAMRDTLYYTIHAVHDERQDPARLARHARPGQLPAEEEARLKPGLVVHFQQDHAGQTYEDSRRARMAALYVPPETAPTSQLMPGPFALHARGYVRVPLRGEYEFYLEGTGSAELLINGRVVLSTPAAGTSSAFSDLKQAGSARVSLYKGYNTLEVRYTSPPASASAWRLYWQGQDFTAEPVPPTALFAPDDDPLLERQSELRRGRELVAELRCASCHQAPPAGDGAALPAEFARNAPELKPSATRLNRNWIYHWLLDPAAHRNDIRMPRLFDAREEQSRRDAADLAAWLSEAKPTVDPSGSIAHASPDEQLAVSGSIGEGLILYEDLGCIACHRFTEPGEDDEFDRISLHYVGQKYRPGALAEFLRAPHRHYRWTRMPDFHLTAEEASALAAYLRSESHGELQAAPEGNPARGPQLLASYGCVSCHTDSQDQGTQATDVAASAQVPPLAAADLSQGCLAAETKRAGVPDYAFSQTDLAALRAVLSQDHAAMAESAPAEAAERLVAKLRCTSCHHRDGALSPLGTILSEEGSRGIPPESLPDLSWAGEKLRPEWIEQLLGGQLDDRARPWLKARMPAFPAYAPTLAHGLAAEHGFPPQAPSPGEPNPELAELGQQLTLATGGLDCRQCHGVGAQQPRGDDRTQIALGINFAQVAGRLRPDFYHRFVLDPPRYDTNTKMPKLSADGRTTKVTTILDGNARKQFEAIWHYLQTVEK